MAKCKDLTGKTFGRLKVVGRTENKADRHAVWECRCECGNTTTVAGNDLRLGRISSCGCLANELEAALDYIGLERDCSYNPVYRAYKALVECPEGEEDIAIEEAIGYLGEALQ